MELNARLPVGTWQIHTLGASKSDRRRYKWTPPKSLINYNNGMEDRAPSSLAVKDKMDDAG